MPLFFMIYACPFHTPSSIGLPVVQWLHPNKDTVDIPNHVSDAAFVYISVVHKR